MYYTLCIALCLAVMFLVYSAVLLVSIPGIGFARKALGKVRPQTHANALFFLRMAPLALALTVSLGLGLPAFLKFEPPATEEGIGLPALVLATLGAAGLLLIAVRFMGMLHATARLERRWSAEARRLYLPGAAVPVCCVSEAESLLAVTGIFRPRIFVSCDVAELLTREELEAALCHELAHVRSLDNLRQLLLKSVRVPLAILHAADRAWAGAAEIAADESAVRSGASALELSSALIKVGRLRGNLAPQMRLAASHLAPAGCGTSTALRAAHLRGLLENESLCAKASATSKTILTGLAVAAAYLACLATLLPAVHEALELLVR
jgi:Zn-dependent protease with chaperone function